MSEFLVLFVTAILPFSCHLSQ